MGGDIARGLVRPYPPEPICLDEKTTYGQVLRALLALTIERLGLRWYQTVMLVDWGQCEAQMLASLQPDASVILALLGDSIALCCLHESFCIMPELRLKASENSLHEVAILE